MVLKFLYITEDPFINKSEEFVRILAILFFPLPGAGTGYSANGQLTDPSGNTVAFFSIMNMLLNTEATAYPYTFTDSFHGPQIIIIPPGWSFSGFGRAIAVQGSLEEVLRVH